MKSFPKRYAVYLAAIAYLAADYRFGGPLTRGAKPAVPAELGPVVARAYGMPLPEATLEAAILDHQVQRGFPIDPEASEGLRLRITDSLLANAIVRTWVKDEGTFFPGTDAVEREDAWVEEKLEPALEVSEEEIVGFREQNPGVPEAAARRYLADFRRGSAVRALKRQVLLNAAENTVR